MRDVGDGVIGRQCEDEGDGVIGGMKVMVVIGRQCEG